MANPETAAAVQRELRQLFYQALELSSPLQQLHLIGEKIASRGLQEFDSADVAGELGHLQQDLSKINQVMLRIYDLLAR